MEWISGQIIENLVNGGSNNGGSLCITFLIIFPRIIKNMDHRMSDNGRPSFLSQNMPF